MAEHNTKGDADPKSDVPSKSDVPKDETTAQDDIAQLRQGLDDVRSSVAALTARLGEGAVVAKQMAGEVAEDVADRANKGVVALRSGIEEQPFTTVAFAFFAGVAISGLVMSLLLAGSSSRPQR